MVKSAEHPSLTTHSMAHLTEPVHEHLRGSPAFRVGPDRHYTVSFADAPWSLAWIAYWYRDHRLCADPHCRYQTSPTTNGGHAGGEGVGIVAFRDGLYGVYGLGHSNADNPLNWDEIVANHRRITWPELDAMRGQPLPLRNREGAGYVHHHDHDAIWSAVDAARVAAWCLVSDE